MTSSSASAPRDARAPAVPERTPASAAETGAPRSTAAWLSALRTHGAERDRAIADLHALLLRAARFEARRRGADRPALRETLEDIALQSADDALVAVLAKLGDFRGESRFTTWAYKFAILETAVALRRRAWQGREIPLEHERWNALHDLGASPEQHAASHELLAALRDAIARDLTDHQRDVLVAVTLDDVPIDVLAERLNTTRGALYKTLHDGRRKLRAELQVRGFDLTAIDAEATR